MNKEELAHFLSKEGYYQLKEIQNRGMCGLFRLAFTVGLFCNLDEGGYSYRYCFHNNAEAIDAINSWDGVNDPPGNWIKRKGEGGDYINPNYIKEESYSG